MTVWVAEAPSASEATVQLYTLACRAQLLYIALYDGITLDRLLTSSDPWARQLGEALEAEGQGSFVPAGRARALLRAAVEEETSQPWPASAIAVDQLGPNKDDALPGR
jgi:hypothetical protein